MTTQAKIIALRKLIPLPITQAKELLMKYDGKVEDCFEQAKQRYLEELQTQTGYEIQEIAPVYTAFKYDFNKTVGHFRRLKEDTEFDRSRLLGMTDARLALFEKFLQIEDHEGLLSAILMDRFDEVVSFLSHQLNLMELGSILETTKVAYYISPEKYDFTQSEKYRQALKTWENSLIQLENEFLIVSRSYESTKK